MVPQKKDAVYKALDKYIHTVDDVPKEKCDLVGTVGWCYILTRALLGKGYRICICEDLKGKELYDFVLMHEIGHIIFGHSELKTILDQELAEQKIRAAFSSLKKYFEGYKLSEVFKYFQAFLYNTIRDFEVNSRLFSEEEFAFMEKGFSEYLGGKAELCWPARYGFPLGLTSNEYLLLILENPEKFFMNSIGESGEDGEDGEASNRKLDPQSLKRLEKKIQDFVDKMRKEYEKQESLSDEQMKEQARENDVQHRLQAGSEAEKIEGQISDWSDYKNLENKIYSLLYKKEQVLERRDQMYNYNRARYGTNVLIPKIKKQQLTRVPYLTVLLDVSGSINTDDVLGFCEVFKSLGKRLSKKCRIVFWNTELVKVFENSDEVEPYAGGGTHIKSGLEWCWENRKPDDLLFVVSDCEDRLESWLKIYKETKYLVCWQDLDRIRQIADKKYQEFKKEWKNILVKE